MSIEVLAVEQGFYFIRDSLHLSTDAEFKNSKSLQGDKEKYTEMRHRIVRDLLKELNDPVYAKAKCALEAIQEFFAKKDSIYEMKHKNPGSPGFLQGMIESKAKTEILKKLKEISNPKSASKADGIKDKIFQKIDSSSSDIIKKRLDELQKHVEKRISEKFPVTNK